MQRAMERSTVVVDRYTRFCLTVIAILLTVLIIGLWAGGPVSPAPTHAAAPPPGANPDGIGNPGAQRAAMISAINTTNQKLDQIIRLLESGKIKVALVEGEAKNAPAPPRKPAK